MNKKITKSSKQIKEEKLKAAYETTCPECNNNEGKLINTNVEKDVIVKQYKCRFPGCGCEYEIENARDAIVPVDIGESMWNSGGAQQI